MLISLEEHKINCTLKISIKASNNEAEYEAILASMRLDKELKVGNLQIFSDSQIVVKQVMEEYQALWETIAVYLRSAHILLESFNGYSIVQVPRADNTYADALAYLASTKEANMLGLIPVKHLARPNKEEEEVCELGPNELTTNKLVPSDHGPCTLACDPDNELHPKSSPNEMR